MNVLSRLIRLAAEPLTGSPRDYDSLLKRVGDAQVVLLGASTHGTHEFYRERAQITKRLIREMGFAAVAIEADWPDAWRVNRFANGGGEDPDATEALGGFKRFPQWMWRNADVLDFVGWLREHNDSQQSKERKAGFYGLDLFSLRASIGAVVSYLAKMDPRAADRARQRYARIDHFGPDIQSYGLATGLGMTPSAEDDVVTELIEMRLREAKYLEQASPAAADEFYCAEQNALIVRNAEHYYRTMFQSEVSSWNLRENHMMETLAALIAHLEQSRGSGKVVVWAHNSHVGSARATQMGERGEVSLGQLARERYGHQAMLIGLTTHQGTVTAASEWDAPAERKRLVRSVPESYEMLFHLAGHPRFWLEFGQHPEIAIDLRGGRLERSIGVIYHPETEATRHSFTARMPDQFDAVLHFDHSRAVEPLERAADWEVGEVEETFPTGL